MMCHRLCPGDTADKLGSGSTSSAADAFHAEGFACRKRGDFVSAIAAYTKAIHADPRHFKALFNRGFAYDKVSGPLLLRLLLLFYDDWLLYVEQLKDFTSAIRDYTRALEVDPSNAYAFYNRGISHDRNGDFSEVWCAFVRACILSCGVCVCVCACACACVCLHVYVCACVCDSHGIMSQAITDFTSAIGLLSTNADFYHNRGFCYRKKVLGS